MLTPIPQRQPHQTITIAFRQYVAEMYEGQATGRKKTQFRHRDGRVWQAVISKQVTTVHAVEYKYVIQLASAGCRTITFVALLHPENIVQRFANLSSNRYARITADAKGTTEHPRSNDIGVFRISIVKFSPQRFDSSELERSNREGIGRIDGPTLTIFPDTDELFEILESCCGTHAIPLLADGINTIGTRRQNFGDSPLDGIPPIAFNTAQLNQAITRNFTETFVDVAENLHNGIYRTREARNIDFGESDNASSDSETVDVE